MSLNRLSSIVRIGALAAGGTLAAGYAAFWTEGASSKPRIVFQPDAATPSREEQFQSLAKGTQGNPFDVLIIGGGATGTGCAVDATTRYRRTVSL